MPSQDESPALRVARARVEAWSKGLGQRHAACSPRRPRHRHAHRTLPATHRPDRRRRLHDCVERVRRAHRAGSVRELAGVGDDHNALLALDLQAAFDPSGPAVPGAPPGSRSPCGLERAHLNGTL